MKVLGIGQVMLDVIMLLDEYPTEGDKVIPTRVQTSVGGSAVSALVTLSNLGVECTLLAGIGDDDEGRIIQKTLNNEKLHFIPSYQDKTKTHTVLVNSQNGSRTVIKDGIESDPITDISVELIHESDIILFDRHVHDSFKEVIKKRLPKNKLLIDPSVEASARTLDMIKHADYPIIPIEILRNFDKNKTIGENLQSIFELSGNTVVVTLGEYGTVTFDGDEIHHINPIDIEVKDTLSAGDVFRGAFTYGVLRGMNLQESIRYGNIAAALQCTRLGSVSAIPRKKEIDSFAETAQEKNVDISDLFSHISLKKGDKKKYDLNIQLDPKVKISFSKNAKPGDGQLRLSEKSKD